MIKEATLEHKKSLDFLNALQMKKNDLINECGKKTITKVFQRAKEVLSDEAASPDCFEFQIAFYRNYASGKDKILEVSNWVKKPDELKTFMSQNKTSGGQGNEAIEIGLWHCNREHDTKPITQIMLIGDATPNTEEDVHRKREY